MADMKETALRLFQGLARSYDRTVEYATLFQDRYWKRWVSEQSGARKGDLVLDIGCGTLLMEEWMSALRCRFIGLDLTKEMLWRGQSKALSGVALLVRGDGESLPFSDATFDIVISCYVAKYVEVAKFTSEMARVAKPGATIVVYDFVRPGGAASPIIEIYIQAGLRVANFLFGLSKKDSAFAFGNLPWIVDSAVWDTEFVQEMQSNGLQITNATRLTGGVVFACSARKTVRPYRHPLGLGT